ncbi:MAG: hypothetical protein E6K13_08995 [Methanobacteriota archaeon]|nr:MAG: hypothetical protein E6K13_08995 [Euryarchaeota archaeon]
MAPKKDAALRVLQWELGGHGGDVLRAMLAHPDLNLADAVDMIERENPGWAGAEPPSDKAREPEEAPEAPPPRRGRAGPEILALQQEFATFRHLLRPAEAKELEAAFKELSTHPDPDALAELRRRLRSLALQAAFWRDLAGPGKTANALGVVLLRSDGGVIAHGGASEPLLEERVARAVRGELEKRGSGVYVMHLSVGRLVIARGKKVALATLFRHTPGKEVVKVLERTVGAIEENMKAAERTFSNAALASRYADALLKLVQRISG